MCIAMVCSEPACAQAADKVFVRGIVRDSVSTQGLPHASVQALPKGPTVVADDRGIFEMQLPATATHFVIHCQGYGTRKVDIQRNSLNLFDISLAPEAQELKEVVIKRKKYSKRNNPAVDFAKRIRSARDLTDPRRNDYYSYRDYERITLGLNNFDTTQANSWMRAMPYLKEHVDESEIDGRPVLTFSVKDKASTTYWQRDGKKERHIVEGSKSVGVDEFINNETMQSMLDELLREVNLYDNNIRILRNDFVSPLAPTAPDFYRFYLVDSAAVVPGSDKPHISLAFYPRNKSFFGFSGHLYVPREDSTMFISRIEMRAPKEVNLNWIRDLNISQTFEKAPDGSRLKTSDNMVLVVTVLPKLPEMYVTRKLAFTDHSFARPAGADTIFGVLGTEHVDARVGERDSAFWEERNTIAKTKTVRNIDLLMDRLRAKSFFYWAERTLDVLVDGWIPTGRKSYFDVGPITSFASYNALEGFRTRLGGMTTTALSKHWFGGGYAAYGFRDHKWKYSGEVEYSFNAKRKHVREFPVHSLRLMHRYDIDRLGSHYLAAQQDNFLFSLSRESDNHFSYLRQSMLEYTLELRNNLSIQASGTILQQNASPYLRFITAAGTEMSHYNETMFAITLRWAPGEKFMQTKSVRKSIDSRVPVFAITHRFAPKGFLGSKYTVNRTELSVTKRFGLSFMGELQLGADGGYVWGTAPFPELLIPNANLSYTIQPGSFAMLNPMEFINSQYASANATWRLKGALFNLIPGWRRLGLREVASFSALWGKRSARNNPGADNNLPLFPADVHVSQMTKTPYMEASVGVENIFRLFRIDYVWRLSYLDRPYPIDRHGIRFGMKLSF